MKDFRYKKALAKNKAYIIRGATSGIGRRTALDVAVHGAVVLVGRDREKPEALEQQN